MKATIEKLNELRSEGLIAKYAIGGGIAHFYYIEAGTTYDLDIMVMMNVPTSQLVSLTPLYEWARSKGYDVIEEHIVIEGVPVQFLPVFNDLVTEAVEKAKEVEIFGVRTFIMLPEYLMAIMLDTSRPKDNERLLRFFSESSFSIDLLEPLVEKFNLVKKYNQFKRRYDQQ